MICIDSAMTVRRYILKMNDFWSRKREELQKEGVIPTPRPSVMKQDGAWWMTDSNLRGNPQEPQNPPQPRPGETRQTSCPHCHSENYMKPSASITARCFDCGYTAGRELNELELPGIAPPDANKLKVKQLPSQGHFGRSKAEINQNNAALEQSAQGKAKLS